jgi:hypothetical protein
MKRSMLWSVFAVAAVGLALIPSVARAGAKKSVHASANLKPVGDEPNAAGRATVRGTVIKDPYGNILYYNAGMAVTCTGLTPGQTYLPAGTYFTSEPLVADSQGSFTWYSTTVGFLYGFPKNFGEVWVYRQTATGSVLVLYGAFH